MKMAGHMGMEEGIEELNRRRAKAAELGGAEQVAAQHARGRLTARERIAKLTDAGTSFREFGMLNVSERPEMADRTPADARITGIGMIHNRKTSICADDRTALGGSDGWVGSFMKRPRLHTLFTQKGYPEIYLGDNLGGLRLPDGMGSAGMSRAPLPPPLLKDPRETPRVAAIMGECFGEPSWMASLADFVVMLKNGCMGAAGPRILKIAIGEEITPWELGGWDLRYNQTGEVDKVAENDEECLNIIREYLTYMPAHNGEEPPIVPTKDPADRRIDDIGKIVPDELNKGYDMHRVIKRVADDGKIFELKAGFGKSLITCLARLSGRVVGFIANNPFFDAGAPSVQSCEKAASFICLCDSFNIPLIHLADVPGMFPGSISEKQKLPAKIINWLEAQNLATVPKLSIIMRKSYGIGYNVMMQPCETADFVVAWPTASVSFVDPTVGVELVEGRRIEASPNPRELRERLKQEWATETTPWKAAEGGYFDDVIDPRDTRRWLIDTLDIIVGYRRNLIGEHKLRVWPTKF